MPVLPIVLTGDPVLHTPAKAVETIDAKLQQLVADMIQTMHEAPGVGLAAPQVGVPLRVFVWDWTDEEDVRHEGAAINPTLWLSPTPPVPADEDLDAEGCLSVPGERYPLRRAEHAILQATALDGTPFEIEASGWLARIFQHEFDHLDGVLYVDRLEHVHRRAATKAVRREGWVRPGLSWLPGVDHLDD